MNKKGKKQHPHGNNDTPKGEWKPTICLSCVKGLSEKIKGNCKSIPSSKLRMVFRPIRIIRQTLSIIKKIPSEKQVGVVYEIPCWNCDGVYVSGTGRTAKRRNTKHKPEVKIFDSNNKIAVHMPKNQHQI